MSPTLSRFLSIYFIYLFYFEAYKRCIYRQRNKHRESYHLNCVSFFVKADAAQKILLSSTRPQILTGSIYI